MRLNIIVGLLLTAATAFAVAPNFSATTPAGVQRGTEVEVRLTGDRLDDAEEIFFYDKGITAEIVKATNNAVTAKFKIAPDCRLGEHNLRVRTKGGLSALRMFYVGTLPNSEEKEPNNELKTPQKIDLNITVAGSIDSEDVDYFLVEARKGQRLAVEVEGARLGRTMFDSYVAVREENGNVLAESDDTALATQDSAVSLVAPADGKYVIEVRDSSYSGAGHTYRMHVGTFPRPLAVYPMGGMAGTSVEAKFIGDAAGDFTQKIKLPADPHPKFGAVADRSGLATSGNWMRVSPFPNVLEVEPNNATNEVAAAAPAVPAAFNGIISKKGDADLFRFTAKKDQNLDVQVWGRRLGSPIDSLLQVLNTRGNVQATSDDSGGSPDSGTRFRVPADGEYFVKVTDHQGRGGPGFTYRVEVSEAPSQVTLTIPDTARYDNETRKSIVVARGNRLAILFNTARDNFSGALDLKFDGLPKGVKYYTDTVSNNVSAQVVVFEADADAPVDGNLLTPVAKSVDDSKKPDSVFRHRSEWVRIQNQTVYTQTDVYRIAAAVTEELPFKINLVEPQVPIVQNGTLDLKIVVDRKEGFDEPITVKMVWNPPGLSSLPDMTIPKGTNSMIYRVNANGGADLRKWKVAIVGQATVKGGTAYNSSQLATIEVAAPYVSGKMDLTSIERGKSGKIICKLEQKAPFDGKAAVTLVGLPFGVTTKDIEITKDSTEAVFDLETSEKTNPGLSKNLFCSVIVKKNGETVPHSIAQGGILRIDAPRVKLAGNTAAAAPAKK